ncbi:ATP-binding cassette domain-containing protein [Paludicola sp. MB14-C6]|uniref:ATP-binding cassette domain-containing protein n=1 Tax=Paludihabitans sp. MB14-C6 TaxID=3070656 RepID=UPI0027DE1322|nr:ATP-binding cassette domain-containing protein [Paludicola sp. MB14-C6]WMJ23078.1 ATP-binding cassette domain-containing protein [Paludicola sp. MB14-C6]
MSNDNYEELQQDCVRPMISCENLVKIYKTSEIEVVALQGLDLSIEKGELMAIIGNSGSGKSTLLNMLGGLDTPSAGNLYVDNKNIQKLKPREFINYKRETVGFVWQNNARNLIPYLTAKENIEMPFILSGNKPKYSAIELLEMVGLSDKRNSKLYDLSGGQQQRIAIAIGVANNPKVLLADEPTGAVDTKTTKEIFNVFHQINDTLGTTIVIVTHDKLITKLVNRVVSIKDGKIGTEMHRKSYSEVIQELDSESIDMLLTHDEFSIVDKSGRVQIPQSFIQALDIKQASKLKMELKDKQIIVSLPE